MPKVRCRPHLRLREDSVEARGRSTYLLGGEVSIRTIEDPVG